LETAEKLGAPIIKALLGKACVPDDSPYTTGSIGLLGTRPSQEALERCDHPAHGWHLVSIYGILAQGPGKLGPSNIDLDSGRIGCGTPWKWVWPAIASGTLQKLFAATALPKDRSFLDEAQRGMTKWWKSWKEPAPAMTKTHEAAGVAG